MMPTSIRLVAVALAAVAWAGPEVAIAPDGARHGQVGRAPDPGRVSAPRAVTRVVPHGALVAEIDSEELRDDRGHSAVIAPLRRSLDLPAGEASALRPLTRPTAAVFRVAPKQGPPA